MRFHARIHPVNYPILRQFSMDHPAVRALQIHAEACDICVGKEIDWPHLGIVGIDQKWFSDVESREMRFSGFAYQYISYDLFLDGWVESDPKATDAELRLLDRVPKMRALLRECEEAAHTEKNAGILPLIAKANEFVNALEEAILCRVKSLGQKDGGHEGAVQKSSGEHRVPLKFHPRIYRGNYSLLRELPADHPAVRALQVHAEAYDVCARAGICGEFQAGTGIDQTWFSDVDLREHRFSSFAHDEICYDLFLDGWVESAPEATEAEMGFLADAPKMRVLLHECEEAANSENNTTILPLLAKANEYVDALEQAIVFRLKGLEEIRGETDWVTTL